MRTPQTHAYVETHDELTGLPNRKCIDELARALGLDEKSDLVVVLIALNGEVSDDGDAPVKRDDILKTLAHSVRLCARGDDVVARLSESQLVLMLTPRIGSEEEARLLARLRGAIAESISHVAGMSVSVGVAYCPEDGITLDQLLAEAGRRIHAGDKRACLT